MGQVPQLPQQWKIVMGQKQDTYFHMNSVSSWISHEWFQSFKVECSVASIITEKFGNKKMLGKYSVSKIWF